MRQLYGQTAKYQVKYKKSVEAKYLTTLLPFLYEWALTSRQTAKKFAEIFYMKIDFLSNEIRKTVVQRSKSLLVYCHGILLYLYAVNRNRCFCVRFRFLMKYCMKEAELKKVVKRRSEQHTFSSSLALSSVKSGLWVQIYTNLFV